jgi:hypothetical protein
MAMSEKYDMHAVASVLLRLKAEHAQELATPVKPATLRDTIAIWGTRGFTAGCVVWVALALVIVASSGGHDIVEVLIATPMGIGVLAVLGAIVGMGIGFPIWLLRRR